MQINVVMVGWWAFAFGFSGPKAFAFASADAVAMPRSLAQVVDETTVPNPHIARIARRALQAGEQAEVIDFEIPLRLRNFGDLQTRVSSGEIVSSDERSARYLPLAADYSKILSWLTAEGIAVDSTSSPHAIFAHASVAKLQSVFGSTFARVSYEGSEYTSAITAPNVPSEVAAVIVGVNGLQPHLRLHRHSHVMLGDSVSGYSVPYLPSQIAQAYGASGLSQTGAGQTIAIVGETTPASSDLTAFWSQTSTSQSLSNVTTIQVAGGTLPASASNSGVEATLDVEWASALAPASQIRVYATVDANLVHFDAAYAQILNDQAGNSSLHQVSISYGAPEVSGDSLSQIDTDNQYFTLMASAGITVFASAGDGGSNPDPNSGQYSASAQAEVESPASDPNVTACGGTSLYMSNSGAISSEVAWSDGGGGASAYWQRPNYQVGTGVSGQSRLVPDVASAGDPNTGGYIVLGGRGAIIGGTSWSAPTWAAFCALLNQGRAAQGHSALGLFNAKLYSLLLTTSFHDITSGSNGAYSAGVGYDECTGVGTPNLGALLTALGGGTSSGSGSAGSGSGSSGSGSGNSGSGSSSSSSGSAPTISSQPVSVTVNVGQSLTFRVIVTGTGPFTYQWQFNGAAIAGATGTTYAIPRVQLADAGGYTVVVGNASGSITSAPATLTVTSPPTISGAPRNATVADGGSAAFAVTAGGNGLSYQWQFNGSNISGATASTLNLSNVATTDAGTYTVEVSNSTGSVSRSGTLTVTVSARLINLSSRAYVDSADPLVAGFVLQGSAAKNLLLRAVGPGLAAYGISAPLSQPQLTLYNSSSAALLAAGAWSGASSLTSLFKQVGAFPLTAGSADVAIEESLSPATYSAAVSSNGGPGVVLEEIYDADAVTASTQVINLSSRSWVGSGQNALAAGFVIAGSTSQTVLVRGIGPGLAQYGLSNVLSAPQLAVFNGSGEQIAIDTGGWSADLGSVFASVGAFGLPAGSADCALVLNLAPGTYSLELTGAGGTTGTGLVEIYSVP
jgi:kumamolisin